MSSAAQIEANQTNATKQGFFSKHAVLLNDHRQFESLRNSCVYQFSPTNIVEVALLDQLVLAAWNIERTWKPNSPTPKPTTKPSTAS